MTHIQVVNFKIYQLFGRPGVCLSMKIHSSRKPKNKNTHKKVMKIIKILTARLINDWRKKARKAACKRTQQVVERF